MMTPKNKIFALVFSLILPYTAIVVFFASRLPRQPLPGWLPYFGACYIFAIILLASVMGQRIARNAPQQNSPKSQATSGWVRGRVIGLIGFWSLMFLYGAYRTFNGDFPLERAIPAGVILLAFIGLFARLLYQDYRTAGGADVKR
jgi:hypothetical protein